MVTDFDFTAKDIEDSNKHDKAIANRGSSDVYRVDSRSLESGFYSVESEDGTIIPTATKTTNAELSKGDRVNLLPNGLGKAIDSRLAFSRKKRLWESLLVTPKKGYIDGAIWSDKTPEVEKTNIKYLYHLKGIDPDNANRLTKFFYVAGHKKDPVLVAKVLDSLEIVHASVDNLGRGFSINLCHKTEDNLYRIIYQGFNASIQKPFNATFEKRPLNCYGHGFWRYNRLNTIFAVPELFLTIEREYYVYIFRDKSIETQSGTTRKENPLEGGNILIQINNFDTYVIVPFNNLQHTVSSYTEILQVPEGGEGEGYTFTTYTNPLGDTIKIDKDGKNTLGTDFFAPPDVISISPSLDSNKFYDVTDSGFTVIENIPDDPLTTDKDETSYIRKILTNPYLLLSGTSPKPKDKNKVISYDKKAVKLKEIMTNIYAPSNVTNENKSTYHFYNASYAK